VLKIVEWALIKEKKVLFSLFSILECPKTRTRKIRVLSLKQISLLEASIKIRVFVIIMTKMAIEEGIAMNILHP